MKATAEVSEPRQSERSAGSIPQTLWLSPSPVGTPTLSVAEQAVGALDEGDESPSVAGHRIVADAQLREGLFGSSQMGHGVFCSTGRL